MRIERRLDGLGAPLLEQVDQFAGLLPRPRDDHALAEQRPLVEPAQVIAQAGHLADHEHRGRAVRSRHASASSPSVPVKVCCVGSVPS